MGTVVGTWRLRLLLVLIIFVTCIYTVSAMFTDLGGEVDESGYLNYSSDTIILDYNQTEEGIKQGGDFIGILTGFGDFLTFSVIDNPWARLLMTSIMSLVAVVIAYIIFTFIKEFIPFV